ncbi:hypothetical protein C8J57DRAFT_1624748, partial [Mycena rebaudengoi]
LVVHVHAEAQDVRVHTRSVARVGCRFHPVRARPLQRDSRHRRIRRAPDGHHLLRTTRADILIFLRLLAAAPHAQRRAPFPVLVAKIPVVVAVHIQVVCAVHAQIVCGVDADVVFDVQGRGAFHPQLHIHTAAPALIIPLVLIRVLACTASLPTVPRGMRHSMLDGWRDGHGAQHPHRLRLRLRLLSLPFMPSPPSLLPTSTQSP